MGKNQNSQSDVTQGRPSVNQTGSYNTRRLVSYEPV